MVHGECESIKHMHINIQSIVIVLSTYHEKNFKFKLYVSYENIIGTTLYLNILMVR